MSVAVFYVEPPCTPQAVRQIHSKSKVYSKFVATCTAAQKSHDIATCQDIDSVLYDLLSNESTTSRSSGMCVFNRHTLVCSASSLTRTVACRSTRKTSSTSTAVNVVLRCRLISSPSLTTHTATCSSVRIFSSVLFYGSNCHLLRHHRNASSLSGASIPMGQGGHVPPNIWTGGT